MKKDTLTIKHIIALLLLSYIFLFHGIGDYSLKEPDEGRYAEIPREMIELNDYIVPHLNYVRYFEKPPLFYWAVAVSYKCFGINEWAFRFPNAFSAFLCVAALYIFIRRWINRETAFISSIILISSFGFFSMARIVTIDMFFSMWLFLSLLFFYGYYKEKKLFYIYFFYAILGLATLAKGFVPIMLVAVTIIIFLLSEKKMSFLKELKWVKGLAIYCLIVLPWLLTISLKEKEFFYFFVIDQHILRFLTSKHKRTGSIFYFFPVLFGGMFPWSIFIPRGIIHLWNKSELRLFIIWSIVVFIFFSISKSKLPPYILPIFPPLSIMIGYLFYEKWRQQSKISLESLSYIFIFSLFAIASILGIKGALNQWVNQISSEALNILDNLNGFLITVSVVSILSACLFCLRRFNRFSLTFYILSIFSFLFITTLLLNLNTIDTLNTTKKLADTINEKKDGDDYIINYASYDQTLPFYTKKRIVIASYTGELEMGSKYDDSKTYFIDEDTFINLFKTDKNIFCVLKSKRLNRLKEKIPEKISIIACHNERCLITNKY
ncbi:MAG: glycosyltransferase family 39 protein [Proteobacteria bacterium]|nr:glycosyltransferase family 39 protein [Pseudomonadota bacterium]